MSTRGSTAWDGDDTITTPDWIGEPVCARCDRRRCNCVGTPAIGANIILGGDGD